MRWRYFFARVAFICNLFFLLCLLLRYSNITLDEASSSLIIILGWLMAIIVNGFSNLTLIVKAFTSGKKSTIPIWLILVNFIFLVFEIYYLFLNPEMI
ncbi:MAG TPA: hypothetical protein VFN30_12315 [Chitinophagaceae bacterium]|nr:hypothetical protein [Chitinophagaceae bacterium]